MADGSPKGTKGRESREMKGGKEGRGERGSEKRSLDLPQRPELAGLLMTREQLASVRDAQPRFDQPRAPEDFDGKPGKIYVVGVLIAYQLEDPKRAEEYRNILIRAKNDGWPVYTSQAAKYFISANRDGWEMVMQSGISVIEISRPSSLPRRQQNMSVTNEVCDAAQKAETPIIFLRPGSPYFGDAPVQRLLQKGGVEIEILNAKSGLDIVGDLAEIELQREGLSRQYMGGYDVLNLREVPQVKEDLLLIYAVSNDYKRGFTGDERLSLAIVVEKLIQLGFADKSVYIKGPETEGLLLTVKDLAVRVDEFPGNEHYTLAILLKDK